MINDTDKRAGLHQLLSRYHPVDKTDEAQRAWILSFVEENENCFDRSNTAGHVTGSAWVVDQSGKKVLLTHHRKLGKWLQLGGHADGNPDLLAVAMKEAEEESGLKYLRPFSTEIFDVDVHAIPAYGTDGEHYHYDIRFAFQTTGLEIFTKSDESNELAWVEMDHVGSLSQEESLLRMVRKWKRSPDRVG